MSVDLLLIAEIDRLMEEVKLLRARAVDALERAEAGDPSSPAPRPASPPTIADGADLALSGD
jgi:hypothetical protein